MLVEEAGKGGADIVCLPEFSAAPVRDSKFQPEPVPGSATKAFSSLAAKYTMYVIVPLIEDSGGSKHYNTAVLLDRSGNIAQPFNTSGMYRGSIDGAGNFVVAIYR